MPTFRELEPQIGGWVYYFTDNLAWYLPSNIKFECKMCGRCCRELQPMLFWRDIELISEKIGSHNWYRKNVKNKTGFAPRTVRRNFSLNFDCIFLKGNLCSVYPDYPLACWAWPFNMVGIIIKKGERLPVVTFVRDSFCIGFELGKMDESYLRERDKYVYDTFMEIILAEKMIKEGKRYDYYPKPIRGL